MRASKLLLIASIAVAKLSIGQGYPSAEDMNSLKNMIIQTSEDENVKAYLQGALLPEAEVQATFARQENLAQLGLSEEARNFLYEYELWKNAQESQQHDSTLRTFFDAYESEKGQGSLRPVIAQMLPPIQRAATYQGMTNAILDDQIKTAKDIEWNFRARNSTPNSTIPGALSDLDITLHETVMRIGQEYVQANYGSNMTEEKQAEVDSILADIIKENTAEGEKPMSFEELTQEQKNYIHSQLIKRIGEAIVQNAVAAGKHEALLQELEKTTDLKIQALTESQRANQGLNQELVKQLREFVAEYDPTMLNSEDSMPVVAESENSEAGSREIATQEEKFVEEETLTPLEKYRNALQNLEKYHGIGRVKIKKKKAK